MSNYLLRPIGGLPSASPMQLPAMTAEERAVWLLPGIEFWLECGVLQPGSTTALADRTRLRSITRTGGTNTTLNGHPAIEWPGTDNAGQLVCPSYEFPQDYFIAILADLNDGANARLCGRSSNTGQPLRFLISATGSLRGDHGSTGGQLIQQTGLTVTGPQIFWFTRRSSDGAGEIGMSGLTALKTGSLTTNHTGGAGADFFGDSNSGTFDINGKGVRVIIHNGYLGGAGNAATRGIILDYLAQVGGFALGA